MFASRRVVVLGGDAFRQEHSLEFDGITEWVSLGTSVNAGTTATFSVWIKRDDADGNRRAFAIVDYE